MGEVEGNGEVGKLNGGGDEGDGGGNSSKIRGCGKRWAVAVVSEARSKLPNSRNGKPDATVTVSVGRLNRSKNLVSHTGNVPTCLC